MRIVCISDTHMAHRGLHLPDGDVLIHAGDATSNGTPDEVDRFLGWFASQPHEHKLLIAGNHDWLYQRDPDMVTLLLQKHQGITYLQDSGIEVQGVKFWGAPWQPWFMSWAFNLPRRGQWLRDVWNLIPIDTEVLITHGPPHGVLDQVDGGEHLGCEELRIRLATVKPRLHVFGHIHDAYGTAQSRTTVYVNACNCNEAYRGINRPIVVDLLPRTIKIHGIKPSKRRQRMEAVQAILARPKNDAREEALFELASNQKESLQLMADIHETTLEELLQEYVARGLQADLARVQRVENRPSQRLVPFIRLQDESTRNQHSPGTTQDPTDPREESDDLE
jgi:hypothetical protein